MDDRKAYWFEQPHMIIVDTNDAAVHTLIATHVARVFQEGAYTMATVAEPSSVAIETIGDLIKRQWSLFVNGAVNQQGKLRA